MFSEIEDHQINLEILQTNQSAGSFLDEISKWQTTLQHVEASSVRYRSEIWNVHELLVNKLPPANNHVECLNQRLKCQLAVHPHIFNFIELLLEEHEYQHHKSEESRVQLRKRKKVNDAIDENLELLLNDHKRGLITDMQLAIKCGRALKTKLVK